MQRIQAGLAAWRDILGSSRVVVDEAVLERYQTATFATRQRTLAVIEPATTEEVAGCLKIASQLEIPVYAISGGKNWGYGSRVPVRDGSVVMDLRRMDRIRQFDHELAFMTVEPGVTFQQAYSFVEERTSDLMLNVTGGSPHGSLLANALERGLGFGPAGDRFAHVCSFEVVLPTGEIIRTGFSRFENAKATNVHRWGVGPALDGLFSQSNFGVVTALTTWLTPRPRDLRLVHFIVPSGAALQDALPGLRELSFDPQLTVRMENARRTELSRARRPRIHRMFRNLVANVGASGWFGTVAAYSATEDEGRARIKRVRSVLQRCKAPAVAVDQLVSWVGDRIAPLIGRRDGRRRGVEKSLWAGVPSEVGLHIAYAPTEPLPQADLDLDRDRRGVVWLSPVIPFRSADVRGAIDLVEATSAAHGVAPLVNMRALSGRCLDMIICAIYDRATPGEDDRAAAWCDELTSTLVRDGYIPYRLGIQSMGCLPAAGATDELLQAIKRVVDPNGVLAPGRYLADEAHAPRGR
jgi:4-cresol dehydrogenase (hydroxylating)